MMHQNNKLWHTDPSNRLAYKKTSNHRSHTTPKDSSSTSSDTGDINNGSLNNMSFNETYDVKAIYAELQEISKKLKAENEILNQREGELSEREEMLSVSQSSLQTVTELGVKQGMEDMRQEYATEMERVDSLVKEKTQENRRLRENFETLKQANDILKKELEVMQNAHDKLEKQSQSLQSRVTNLQQKNNFAQRQKEANVSPASTSMESVRSTKLTKYAAVVKANKSAKLVNAGVYETLAVLLDWVCEHSLRVAFIQQRVPHLDTDVDKCIKCLPCLVNILRDLPALCSPRIYLPCLQFIYWSLLHVEQSQTQKSSLVSTLRRLGDELYGPRRAPLAESIEGDRRSDMFFRSSDLHVRFLSCLIILKTMSQVDLLAHIFDTVRGDLKNDLCKELFLYYHATATFLPYMRPINKSFLSAAVDVFLQMSGDTPFLPDFLASCGNEAWFRSVAMAMRSQAVDAKTLEKLSVVLQKLSKIKGNRKYFEVYTIVMAIQELLMSTSADQPFLAINLKSVLLNVTG